ncbi:peptidase family M13-domain-containing protein [Neocallimastix sp. 'constans']
MNLKKISIIISLLLFNLKVHSVPFNKNKVSSKRRNLSFNISENINDIVDILEEKIYDTLPDVDVAMNVTNNIADEETDNYSDVVEQIDTNECTSQECIEISKRILNSLDTSINPCDDFYEFSCGGWIEMNKNKQSYYDPFAQLREKTTIDLKEILEDSYHSNDKLSQKEKEYDEELFNATKNFYSACINSYNTINTNNEILINYINKFNITKALNNAEELEILFAEFNEIGINTLFRIEEGYIKGLPYESIPLLEFDFSIKDKFLKEAFLEIKFSKDKLSLKRYFRDENEYDEYIKEQNKKINNYKEYVKKVLSIIYGSNENKIDSILKSIIGCFIFSPPGPIEFIGAMDYDYNTEIETTSNYYDSYDDYYSDDEYEYTQEIINELNNDSEYEYNENEEFSSDKLIISIKDFNEKYPLINWKLYFEKVFEKYGIAITDESLISEESNFKYVYEFLKETDNKDITNFLEW